jgi:hypothetical protein
MSKWSYKEYREQMALRARIKRSERRLKKADTKARVAANEAHKTYQSPLEKPKDGWFHQHFVNKILSLYGGR